MLTITFPEFRFGCQPRGPEMPRWVAIRKNIRAPGVHTVVTDDLEELVVLLGKAVILVIPRSVLAILGVRTPAERIAFYLGACAGAVLVAALALRTGWWS